MQGSNKTRLTVIGDIMGPSIAGLERLLTQPFGCGEQNMITLAPNVYVQHYLTATDTLDAATKTRAEGNTKQGYVWIVPSVVWLSVVAWAEECRLG